MKLEIETSKFPTLFGDREEHDKILKLISYVEKYKNLYIINRAVLRYEIEPNGKRSQRGSLHWFSKPYELEKAKEIANKWADDTYVIPKREFDPDASVNDLEERNKAIFDKDRLIVKIFNLYEWYLYEAINKRGTPTSIAIKESKFWSYEGDIEKGWVGEEEAAKYNKPE